MKKEPYLTVGELREALGNKLNAQKVNWCCRFHPTDWWHEVGCPHQEWTKEDLLSALITKKKFEEVATQKKSIRAAIQEEKHKKINVDKQ